MELKDLIAVAMAEAQTRYAEVLAQASDEADYPLFLNANGTLYIEESLLGVVLSNVVAMQEFLNSTGMVNIATGMQTLVILMEAIHDTGHLKAVEHG